MTDNNRLALVTGTSSGIGAALASALLRAEWMVIGLARREASLDDPHYRHIALDLGDLAMLETVAAEQLQPILRDTNWLRVGLVNNAAAVGTLSGLEDTTPQQLAHLFAVNTIAPIFLMGLATRSVLPPASFRIVNISTGAAGRPFPGLGDYGSSKAALRLAGMALAAELDSAERPGGRRTNTAILSYEPGVVDTAMQTQARSTTRTQFPWHQPFKDFAANGMLQQPEDVIGEVIDFLSSDSVEPFVERRYGG